MKTILTIACMLFLAICSDAQALQVSKVQMDSLNQKYHNSKSIGITLVSIGGIGFVCGAYLMIFMGLSELTDYNCYEGKNNGKYRSGAVLFFAGGGLAIVGATQLRAAHKISKKMMNAHITLAPSNIPSLKGFGKTTGIAQSTLSLIIPIGKQAL